MQSYNNLDCEACVLCCEACVFFVLFFLHSSDTSVLDKHRYAEQNMSVPLFSY